ncbi:MAG: PAS-domain containing protein [Alphaproteobacteria bacterium]
MSIKIFDPVVQELASSMQFGIYDKFFTYSLIFMIFVIFLASVFFFIWKKNQFIATLKGELEAQGYLLNQAVSVIDSTPFKWMMIDKDFEITLWHEDATDIIGVGEAHTISMKDFLDLFDQEEHVRKNFLEALKSNEYFEFSAINTQKSRRCTVVNLPHTGSGPRFIWLREIPSSEAASLVTDSVYRRILDHIPTPVWYSDIDGRMSYCNPMFADIIGKSPEVIVEQNMRPWSRTFIADNNDETRSITQHGIIGGARRLLRYVEKPMDKAGGSVGYAQDLTEIEQAQRTLDRHISAHREAFEQIATAVAIYGPDKRLNFFNSAYARMFQFDDAWLHSNPTMMEILDEKHRNRMLAETADFPAFKKRWSQLFTTLISPIQELMHMPDERTIRLVAAPHPLGGMILSFEDVTENLVLERQTNTQLAVQKETLDHLHEGVVVYASDNRIRLSNPAFARLWNIEMESIAPGKHIGDSLDDLCEYLDYGDDWPAYKQKIIDHITDRVPKTGRLNRKDKTVLEFSYVPLPDGGHLLSYTDVTDSYRVEQALRDRNDALETTDKVKSEFLANVSFELKAPLNTILGFSEILTDEYFGSLNQEQAAYCKGIHDSSKQLLGLVNDIIDLATIEAGQMSLNLQPVEIKSLLKNTSALLSKRIEDQKIELVINCAQRIKNVVADERRLKQAIFNLLNNSIKYTQPGGKITLSAKKDSQYLYLTVKDTGFGISKKDQDRIFDKFERTDLANSRYSGAGLGLSLVKSLIELHGGKVDIYSKPYAGTEVTCQIPLSLASTPQLELPKLQVA